MAPTPSIDWTRVHACSTSNTFQRAFEIFAMQPFTSSVVYKYYVHLLPRARLLEMTGVCSDGLSRGTSCQQPKKNAQVFSLRDNLFNSHAGNVHVGKLYSEVSISLIRTDHYFTRFCHCEI